MIFVAMAIIPKQWKALQTPDFNGQDPRIEVFENQKYTLSKVMELEIQWGVRMNSKGKDRSKPGMNSLGIRFSGVTNKMKAMRNSDMDIKNIIARLIGERGSESQSTLKGYFGVK